MVAVTGDDGADVLLRDGNGGVGGRYTFKKRKRLQTEANASHNTNLRGVSYGHIRPVHARVNSQSSQPAVETRRGHVFLVRRMITIAGFHLPKVHLLRRRLILIGRIGPRLRYPFESNISSGARILGAVTLTGRVMISTSKSTDRGGEDWGDRWSLQTVQVRRTLVPNYTVNGLPPISRQLEGRERSGATKAMGSARALHER